jgi:hypothetical protein
MLDWLDEAQRRLEARSGSELALELSPADVEALLELARTAAHESGERTNAPLIAYMVGFAHARDPDATVQDVIAAALGTDRSA